MYRNILDTNVINIRGERVEPTANVSGVLPNQVRASNGPKTDASWGIGVGKPRLAAALV